MNLLIFFVEKQDLLYIQILDLSINFLLSLKSWKQMYLYKTKEQGILLQIMWQYLPKWIIWLRDISHQDQLESDKIFIKWISPLLLIGLELTV